MPGPEIDVIVAADQPRIARRYIELHGERLAERLADQLQILACIEGILTRRILDRSSRGAPTGRLGSSDPIYRPPPDPGTEPGADFRLVVRNGEH